MTRISIAGAMGATPVRDVCVVRGYRSLLPTILPRSLDRVDVSPPKTGRSVRYRAFGLDIESELDLPELVPREEARVCKPDLRIAVGAVTPAPSVAKAAGPGTQVADGRVWFETPVGRFEARDGRVITVASAPGVPAPDVRLYLLGTMIGAVLHQRGILPLHANAVDVGRGAIAVAGPSGAGKSTLAAYFRRAGCGVLSDDVCAVTFDARGDPWAEPGLARIKLWGDALAALDQDRSALEPLADGVDKFSLPFASAPANRVRLRRLYVIDAEPAPLTTMTRLTGADAVGAVLANIYRWPLAIALDRAPTHFAAAVRLAVRCDVISLRFRRGLDHLPDLVEGLRAGDVGALPA